MRAARTICLCSAAMDENGKCPRCDGPLRCPHKRAKASRRAARRSEAEASNMSLGVGRNELSLRVAAIDRTFGKINWRGQQRVRGAR